MPECFYWYYERVKKEFPTGESLAAFVDGIVDKLFFTVVEVTDQLNAFKVFETLNARGVQLSASDLLKNYLFSVVDDTKPHLSKIEVYLHGNEIDPESDLYTVERILPENAGGHLGGILLRRNQALGLSAGQPYSVGKETEPRSRPTALYRKDQMVPTL